MDNKLQSLIADGERLRADFMQADLKLVVAFCYIAGKRDRKPQMKLTDEQEAILSGALRTSTNAITRLRSHILLLVSQGFSAARIQHLASVEPGQIADAVEKFHEGGIRAIVPRPQD